ncbi:MAG: hypothetical protein Q7U14_01165, partial [Lacisediminimonas sp.]|nr:hypothetical protein [Lacisediminimonas sp.]
DHLVLTDLRHLQLEQQESRALFDVARPLFDEAGREFLYGTETLWFMRADDWAAIETSAPDAAVGHNIDIWMPRGAGERAWRKLHNEVQMTWHTLDSNHQREASGRRMINALWCWDTHTDTAGSPASAAGGHDQATALLDAFLPGTPRASQASLPALIAAGGRSLAVVDSMTPAALSGDWHQWINAMQATEQTWFAPLLEALRSGKIDRATLVLSDSTRLLQLQCSRWDLKKFWSRPSLAALA